MSRIAVFAGAALLVGGVCALAACGGGSAAGSTERAANPARVAPLPWQRAVRIPGAADEVMLVYVTVPGRPALRWRIAPIDGGHAITLLSRPRRSVELSAAFVACARLQSPEFARQGRLEDGAFSNKPPSVRRQFNPPSSRRLARSFRPSRGRCPLLPRE
jgi:hypothetical protein